jgi:protein-S-isoprenylcysteine O-methyltransferase Ste14
MESRAGMIGRRPMGRNNVSRLLERTFVWGGGAAFVGSLAFMVWTYGVAFRARIRGFDASALLVDILLITAFALHHSVFARDGVKRVFARVVPERLLRSVYVWIASLLLVLVCLLWQPVGGDIWRAAGPWLWIVRAIQPIGLLLTAISVTAISALELAGIESPAPQDSLQETGPYRLVRHPIYLGWVLCVFGDTDMTADRLTFAIATTCYLLVAIPWEERSLERAFASSYPRYRQKVRWRVIPYVY